MSEERQEQPPQVSEQAEDPEPRRGEILPAGGPGGQISNLPRPISGGFFRSTWLETIRYRSLSLVYRSIIEALDTYSGVFRAEARVNDAKVERARSAQKLRCLQDILAEDRCAVEHERALAARQRQAELLAADHSILKVARELIDARADLLAAGAPSTEAKKPKERSEFEEQLDEIDRLLREEQQLDEWQRTKIDEIVAAASGEDKLTEEGKRRIANIRAAVGQARTRRHRAQQPG